MTGQIVATTPSDWAAWTGRQYAVVDGGIERASEQSLQRTPLEADAVALAVGDERLYTLSPDGKLAVRDRDAGTCRRYPPVETTMPTTLCWIGDRVSVGDGEYGRLTVYDTTLRRRIGTVETDLTGPTSLTAVDGTVHALDDGNVVRVGPGGTVETVDTVPSATDIATVQESVVAATPDGLVGTGDTVSPCPVTPHRIAAGQDTLVAAGPDGSDSRIAVWTPDDGWTDWGSVSGRVGAVETGHGVVFVATDSGCLALSRTPRYPSEGTVVAGQFDAGSGGVQWHRLTLDVDARSPATHVSVSYRAGEDPPDLTTDPDPSGDDWTVAGSSTDALLRDATGRYLQVAVELDGDEHHTPRVTAVRATCPRSSMLRDLPELYQGADSAVLKRLLGVYGTFFDGVEQSLERVTRLLDPAAVPSESIGWLAAWLGLEPRPAWPTGARRERLTRALELARTRGTRRGLTATLELLCSHFPGDQDVTVVEPADVPDDSPGVPLDGPRSVLVYAGPFETDRHRRLATGVVDRQTPAHVDATLVPLSSSAALDGSAMLGVNGRLTDDGLVLDETPVGRTSLAVSDDRRLDQR